jgi:adenylate cyclase
LSAVLEGSRLHHLYEELRRRKVLRVAAAYLVVAWLLIQVADVMFEPLGLPAWTIKLVIGLLALGFPMACALAWAYDMGPGGLRKTPASAEAVAPAAPAQAIPQGANPAHVTAPGDPALRAPASAQSVAILPFVDMSPGRDQEYFCDGIAEEIINALCCVRGLRIASRTSSFRFKAHAEDMREIGRQLSVGSVLEGSVRKAGDRVRITAQLLNAADGYHIWSHSYDRKLDDVFAIQTDIAKRLVDALQVTLSPVEDKLLGRGGTRSAQAYDFFLRGQQQLHGYGSGPEAAEMFRRALACDAEFAQAQAGLASALALQVMSRVDLTPSHFDEALDASRRALELEPWMPEAHLARAQLMSAQNRYEEAERDFDEAIRLNPTSYFTYYAYGRHCLAAGRTERAAEMFRTSARLAPEEYTPLGMLSFALQKLNRPEEERQTRIDALRLIDAHLQRFPEDEVALGRGAIMAAWLGRKSLALEYVERAVRARPDGYTGLYNAACTCAILGDIDRAIELLEKAVGYGRGYLDWIENDEDLANLRGDPRFTAIIDRIRSPHSA